MQNDASATSGQSATPPSADPATPPSARKPSRQGLAPPIPLDLDELSPQMWEGQHSHLFLQFYSDLKPEVTDMLVELKKTLPKKNMGIVKATVSRLPEDLVSKVKKCADDDGAIYLFSKYDSRVGFLLPGLKLKFLHLFRPKRGAPITREATIDIKAYLEDNPDYKSTVEKRLLALAEKKNKPHNQREPSKDSFSALRNELAARVFEDYWNGYITDTRNYLRNLQTQLSRRARGPVRRRSIARRAACRP